MHVCQFMCVNAGEVLSIPVMLSYAAPRLAIMFNDSITSTVLLVYSEVSQHIPSPSPTLPLMLCPSDLSVWLGDPHNLVAPAHLAASPRCLSSLGHMPTP